MHFSVFALSSVPDTGTTRQLFDLDDLDDKSVSKIMFHRRKQQTGSSEVLRWDQRAIASLTLIHHSLDQVQMESMNLATHSEEDMLHFFFKALLREGQLVSWNGESVGIPLIHFRALLHAISYPAYWQALNAGANPHLDIQKWLSPALARDLPELDSTSRKLGFPGMLNWTENDVMEAWLQGRQPDVQAFSDLAALNAYLLALRLFTVTGELSRPDDDRGQKNLADHLDSRNETHLAEFVAAWGKA